MLWQRFWLDLCTKQVVSARACTYQFSLYKTLQVLYYLVWKLCRHIAAYILSRLTLFFY